MSADHETEELDAIFEALANRHRREIIYALGLHPCSIRQLADMRDLSLPAIHKHIAVLERADLVSRRKLGRSNFLTLNRQALRGVQDWLGQYHAYWGSEKETLENYAAYLSTDRPTTKEKKQ
jgi:DNA-binding transcriptional ArsR family regulator